MIGNWRTSLFSSTRLIDTIRHGLYICFLSVTTVVLLSIKCQISNWRQVLKYIIMTVLGETLPLTDDGKEFKEVAVPVHADC